MKKTPGLLFFFPTPFLPPFLPWQQMPSDTDPRHNLVRIIRLGLKVYRDPKYTHWLKTSPVAQSARDDSAVYMDEGR